MHNPIINVQIGLRVDSAFACIYDEAGLEIENLEMLFTHEGVGRRKGCGLCAQ